MKAIYLYTKIYNVPNTKYYSYFKNVFQCQQKKLAFLNYFEQEYNICVVTDVQNYYSFVKFVIFFNIQPQYQFLPQPIITISEGEKGNGHNKILRSWDYFSDGLLGSPQHHWYSVRHFSLQISEHILRIRGTILPGIFPSLYPSPYDIKQTMLMFFGEFLALPIFFIKKWRNKDEYAQRAKKAEEEGKRLDMNRLYLLIPCFFDLVSSTLLFMSLNFVSASAYQMLRGGAIVTTFICSILFLKMKVEAHHIWGSFSALVGIIIVGAINTVYAGSGDGDSSVGLQIMGYILIIASLFTQAIFFTSEQKLMSKYYLEPLEIVGFEGMFGFVAYILIVLVLCYIPCPFGVEACVFSHQGNPFMQGWSQFVNQLTSSAFLIVLTVLSIVITAFFNVSGVTITKYINALARVIADVSKTILVWVVGLIITLSLGKTYPNLRWQKLQAMIIIFQLLGFVFLVLGNLIYNRMLVLPWMKKKDQETNQMLIKSKKKSQSLSSENIV